MHTIFFSVHRADLRAIAFQRELLAPFGLSPARYQLLFVIRQGHFRWMRQSDLRRELGVTAATVCKMVCALVRDGLLIKTRGWSDRRQVELQLTDYAVRLLRAIHRRIIAPGYVWLALYSTLSMNRELSGEGPGTLAYWLDHFRRGFRDRARFYFPWFEIADVFISRP